MRGWCGVGLAAALTLGGAAPLAAQLGGTVDLDVAHVQTGSGSQAASEFALSVAPSLRRDWSRFSIADDGSAAVSGRSHYFIQNSLVGTMRSREHFGVVVEGGFGVGALRYRTASTIRTIDGDYIVPVAKDLMQLDARARADVVLGRWGFSLSGSVGENYGGSVRLPWGVEAGVTRELRRVLLFASARADRFRSGHLVSTAFVTSDVSSAQKVDFGIQFVHSEPMLTLLTGATMAFGRAEVTGEIGGRQGSQAIGISQIQKWSEMWYSVVASYRVTPSTLVRAGAGGYPTDYIRQLPNGSYASIGVRFERGKRQQVDWYQPPDLPAFRVDTIAGGARVIRVRAPRALKVELSADFTDWTPLPMRALDGGAWELVLPIAAGTYRVSVRVDGGPWTAPPGLVPVADEFNGEVGVVVIR